MRFSTSALARKIQSTRWHAFRYLNYCRWKLGPVRQSREAHKLGWPLVVSLTSYPARFKNLPLTLKCLLSQTIRPDVVVLWIAEGDKAALTHEITKLQEHGLSICYCADLKSFKKIIPSLLKFPDSFIVTADDDIVYPLNWLGDLVSGFSGNLKEIVCHRAHKIRLGLDNLPSRYAEWEFQTRVKEASSLIFPTSGAGVLYPPGIFDERVTDEATFMSLCPTADDVWLYWMVRLEGGIFRLIGDSRVMTWPRGEIEALSSRNIEFSNDIAIVKLTERFGPCWLSEAREFDK